MLSSDRIAAVDANAAALGVPRKQLMESSGNAVARVVRSVSQPGDRVVLVCGRGNNGGDAFVAARFLKDRDVTVRLLGRPESIGTAIARENWEAIRAAELAASSVVDVAGADLSLDAADVVVDALLGTGIAGKVREPERTAVERLNAAATAGTTVISVDVPTGIDADTGRPTGGTDGVAVDADHVVTFHDEKPGLEMLDATLTVADIGIPAAAERYTGPGDLLGLGRDPDSHKGENGEVLVVGGGPYTGAPSLSARAALRAGADLVRVACPTAVAGAIQGYSADLIVRGFASDRLTAEHLDRLLELATGQDVVVIGPGLGDDDDSLALIRRFLESYSGRVVVDADALRVVPNSDTEAQLICTPHQGELRRMGGETADDPDERAELVRSFAAEIGHTLLVKGRYDVIAGQSRSSGVASETGPESDVRTVPEAHTAPIDVRLNRTGNPGMTVGGTGDVLAGVTGALAARTDPFAAAAAAAYVTGLAGDAAAETNGNGLVATDLIDRLPQALYDE